MPKTQPRPALTLTELAARLALWCWAWRLELTLILLLVTVRNLLDVDIGLGAADLLTATGLAVILAVGPVRHWTLRCLLATERRRRWHTNLAALYAPSTPRVVAGGTDWTGEWAAVRVPAGMTVTDLADHHETLAACFDVDQVRVRRSEGSAGYGIIRALRLDPLETTAAPWPWLHMPATSLWWPIPVGIDEDGQPATITLPEHNLLIGGEPGAGKSVALSQLVAAAALDPNTNLYLLDGKLVELAVWAPTAAATAGTTIGDATEILRHLQVVMDQRYLQLLGAGLRKIPVGTGLHVVVVDELAHYLTWPDKKPRDAFTDTLRDLVSRGRAAGIVVIAATQKPAADVIPTNLRDLFGYRWALRCTTNAASDTILGTGYATTGTSAATIKPNSRGIGWLLHETGTPTRLRAHHLTDTDLQTLARRGVDVRSQHRPGASRPPAGTVHGDGWAGPTEQNQPRSSVRPDDADGEPAKPDGRDLRHGGT